MPFRYFTTLFLAFLFHSCCFGQVTINEVSVKNWTQISDTDGQFPSWIEFYNKKKSETNLSQFFLSDDVNNLKKWQFPATSIPGKSTFLMFASGKDISYFLNWESIILASDEWKYFPAERSLDPNWRNFDFDDSDWAVGPGGFGFGDGDDSTYVEANHSLCLRKKFNIESKEEIARVFLNIDFDDAFVAYLNGVEIARSNIGRKGLEEVTPEIGISAIDNIEAVGLSGDFPPNIEIKKKLLDQNLREGENLLAIRVINWGFKLDDLSAIPFLTVGKKSEESKQLRVMPWWNKINGKLHSNFKLKKNETLYLSNADGKIIDSVQIPDLPADYSYGRTKNGGGPWSLMTKASPDQHNSVESAVDCVCKTAKLNLKPGFYNQAITVALEEQEPESYTTYAFDGYEPSADGPQLSSDLKIDNTRVIRIRSYSDKCGPGKIKSYTYFINTPHDIPVVSIVSHPDNFFDEKKGVYVKGKYAQRRYPYYGANFWNDWEIPVDFQYFETVDSLTYKQKVGLKINGGGSRGIKQKSLRLTARSKYDKNEMKHAFFETKPELDRFKHILLKNAGQTNNYSHLTDLFAHALHKEKVNFDVQAGHPTEVYINGKYWGVHHMREKYSAHYLANLHNLKRDSINLLFGYGFALDGSAEDYVEWRDQFYKLEMSQPGDYIQALSNIEVDNFIDYQIANIFAANADFERANNVKYWASEQEQKKKWKYLFVDLDLGYGKNDYDYNKLEKVLESTIHHQVLFKNLLTNPQFKNYFIARYCDLLNTIYRSENTLNVLNVLINKMEEPMKRHWPVWSSESFDRWQSYYLDYLKRFLINRPAAVVQHMQEAFNLGNSKNLEIQIKEGGQLILNTIEIDHSFSGNYFEGMEVNLNAKADHGYQFSHWIINGNKLESGDLAIKYEIVAKNNIDVIFEKIP